MIAVDTNILVYAHRNDSPFHVPAAGRMTELAEGSATWSIPWPCVHEFLAIVTHPRIYAPPSTLPQAINQMDAWLESPTVVLLAEPEAHWPALRAVLAHGQIVGPRVHDARIVTICQQHGVRVLWSADRDFNRFSGISIVNPLVSA